MANIFEKWDSEIDIEGLQKDEADAAKNKRTFAEIPPDTYEVGVEKMELKASKKGSPMVSIWFKIMAGKFKNSRIFYNQVIDNGFGLHSNNQLLLDMHLDTVAALEKIFTGYAQYANLLMDCAEEIDSNRLTFELDYGEGKNGFHTYKITDVFEN